VELGLAILATSDGLRTLLKNAGTNCVDREMMVNQRLVTSCNASNLEPFCGEPIERFPYGRRESRHRSA
jgi:hypothetical protein